MTGDYSIETPDEAMRMEGVRVFLRSFREESESVEEWLQGFVRMLVDAGLAHMLVAVGAGGGAGSGRDRRVVGCGALIGFVRTAWIAFMGVEPDLQRRGIGGAILDELMRLARGRGYAMVRLDATDVGRGLYAGRGFVAEHPAGMYEIPAHCGPGPEGGPPVRLNEELPEWCLALDREAAGDDRSALLGAVLADGGKVLVVEGEGFGILHGRKVGPVIAKSVDAAVAIVRRGGSLGANRVYVTRRSDLDERFVAGLKEMPPRSGLGCCTRMAWGKPLKRNPGLEFAAYSAATG